MNKKLSPLGLLWISFTSIIGSGWLFGTLYSAQFAGPAAILAWPIGGFLLLVLSLSYAEIGTMLPQSDALASLPLYTHGRLTSVMISGMGWISLAIIPVIETQGLVQYASNYIPGLVTPFGTHYHNTSIGALVNLVLLMSFVLFNYFGLKLFARINAGFTFWKLFIPCLTIIALVYTNYHSENFTQYGGFMPYGWEGVMAAMSSGGVLFSLLGFRQIIILMGEIDNPGKYVPLVIVSSIVLTTLLYTGLQWSFIGSLNGQALTHGWAKLSFAGDAGPFAALVTLAGLIWLSFLLYFDAFISPFSTGLVYSTTAAHMLASMGTTGAAPPITNKMNKYQVPWVSLIINFCLAAVMSFLLHGWQEISAFLVAVLMISYAVGPISLVCLRKQLPSHPRPFRLRFSGIIGSAGFYICTVGVYWSGLLSIEKVLVLTFLCLIFYLIYSRILKKSSHDIDASNAAWLMIYLVGLGLFAYYGNYGGAHLIPVYWDLLYLLIFSQATLALCFISRKPNDHTLMMISRKNPDPTS
ncbi:APC family permease [Legionella bononiensis]|uniref:APC family permease n=1 Tax=Legionella bononiensis TaxID=2793102 RepID=A0ABS1WB58_9GAMM|nr:APC family permease [Legionella bononiensis]MBL7480170.1 APC family permease [Legionella bononiensis]MBL7526599.1 APC family permease [Legionella bononiensis]MBL7562907.1 APC family permease [Legionella bononiensis]